MARVLLINPSYSATYGTSKATITNPIYPTLGLTTIAGEVLRRGHQVEIIDLSYRPYDWRLVRRRLREMKPDIVGITATTPHMNQLRDLSVLCKDTSQDILVVGGGPHISALPVESMKESLLDLAAVGEADLTFGAICDGDDPRTTPGLWYRDGGGTITSSGDRPFIQDLDSLAMPAWHLYDPGLYRNKVSHILVRNAPATIAEFSRGCVFTCDFCASKMTMALGYRKKSPERCAEEVRHLHSLGWREFMLADDIFTSDNAWAVAVAEAILATGVEITWTCTNGIRVESANDALFRTMRRAGCYRVSFGLESGNEDVLRGFGKGGKATLELGREAVKMARRAGVDTNGFFLLGLSADTEASMADTIRYARSLELDSLLFGKTVALPGTRMYNEYRAEGLIDSFDWDEYHARSSTPLFRHRSVDHDTIQRFMKHAYLETVLKNPAYLARRFRRGLRTGDLFYDLAAGLRLVTLPSTPKHSRYDYYAPDRWPRHDFLGDPSPPAQMRPAKPRSASA